MPDGYKKIILPLLECIKVDIVARSVKIMDKLDYLFYVNGSIGAIDILSKYIKEGIKGLDNEKVSLLTRKVVGVQKKPGQGKARTIKTK